MQLDSDDSLTNKNSKKSVENPEIELNFTLYKKIISDFWLCC